MANEYNTIGTYQLNRWLTSKLKDLMWTRDSDGVTENVFKKYAVAGGTVNLPLFVQGAQQPDWTNIEGGAPFIVFSYSTGSGVMWEVIREQAAYVIWDDNTARLRVIQNYMFDLLKRFEKSAEEVNDYLFSVGQPDFEFKYTRVTTSTSPDPAVSEQGRQKGLIVSAFEYTRMVDKRGMLV